MLHIVCFATHSASANRQTCYMWIRCPRFYVDHRAEFELAEFRWSIKGGDMGEKGIGSILLQLAMQRGLLRVFGTVQHT